MKRNENQQLLDVPQQCRGHTRDLQSGWGLVFFALLWAEIAKTPVVWWRVEEEGCGEKEGGGMW